VPPTDNAALAFLDELTGGTRTIARSLLDYRPHDESPAIAAPFADDYSRLLRLLASMARRAVGPEGDQSPDEEQGRALDCQQRLEAEAARLPDRSGERRIAQGLIRSTAGMLAAMRTDHMPDTSR
jgi:hypothetical protein